MDFQNFQILEITCLDDLERILEESDSESGESDSESESQPLLHDGNQETTCQNMQ